VVVTNLHVIEGAQAIKVVLSDGREFAAKQVGKDDKLDLAILQLEMKTNERLPAAKFGNSDTLQVGDVVLAIGNPFGIGQSVSFGIVSAVQRTAAALSPYARFIQTDAPINPGNSGGALVDSTGALVGVNSGIFSKSGASNGIGFAIPASLVQRVVNDITTTGRVVRPWFGAEGQAVTDSVAREVGLPSATGVQLTGVLPNSPAANAGLQRGDVILKLGDGVVEDPADLNEQVLAMPNLLNKATPLTYWRNKHQLQTTVTLTAIPTRSASSQTLVKGYNPLTGVKVEALGPGLNTELNMPLGTKGVVVVDVPDQPVLQAFEMPVQNGDLLMAINGSTIRAPEDVQKALDSSRSGWELRIMRGGKVVNIKTR
jgi:serine protease Do